MNENGWMDIDRQVSSDVYNPVMFILAPPLPCYLQCLHLILQPLVLRLQVLHAMLGLAQLGLQLSFQLPASFLELKQFLLGLLTATGRRYRKGRRRSQMMIIKCCTDGVWLASFSHSFCLCRRNEVLKHQMWINPLQEIVPYECTLPWHHWAARLWRGGYVSICWCDHTHTRSLNMASADSCRLRVASKHLMVLQQPLCNIWERTSEKS